MDLNIKGKIFIICGATSGFGKAITTLLTEEGAYVIAIARNKDKLKEIKDVFRDKVEILSGDITQSKTIRTLQDFVSDKAIDGILVNAAGPPAKSFYETSLTDWDEAYRQLVRWKVEITRVFLPRFIKQGHGRFLYIESAAIKQPLENLVLSTALRLSVAGFVKTVSQEIADKGVTFNILAPGYHNTPAVERLISKKSETLKISGKDTRILMENNIPMKKMGDVGHFASLAVWLLSPLSDYITGQNFIIDGGVVKSTL